MNGFLQLVKEVWKSKKIVWELGKSDFKKRYAGSFFGIFWGFAQPIFTILVFWFVFQVGFRSAPIEKVPFICWLACGMIPWFYFADAWSNAGSCFFEYSYLVKKVVFKTSVLPLVKVLSSLFVHGILLILLMVIFLIYGITPKFIYVQMLYYSFCATALAIGLSYITASIAPFFKDITQIVVIIVQFGMWLTPIMWPFSMIPDQYKFFFKFNPMFYVVEGYRDTLINGVWFWQRYNQTAFFWILTSILFIIGSLLYKKLKPHFADVL